MSLALVVGFCLSAATGAAQTPVREPLSVFVSILPQAEFVREIGGSHVQVTVLVGPGHSPATYEPTPRQMALLSGAGLFVRAGVPFERGLMPKIAGLTEELRIVGRQAEKPGGSRHHHDDGLDPHFWLDPVQAMVMSDTICAVLKDLIPERAAEFESRRIGIRKRLTKLAIEIRRMMDPFQGAEFFVFHPAYGHFARRFGLVQVAVQADGHEPGARQLTAVIDQAKAAGARAIVVQPQFSSRSAETVAAATGAEILVLDPLAEEYDKNLRHIATSLVSALGSTP